jgi:hypothetical protein
MGGGGYRPGSSKPPEVLSGDFELTELRELISLAAAGELFELAARRALAKNEAGLELWQEGPCAFDAFVNAVDTVTVLGRTVQTNMLSQAASCAPHPAHALGN